MVYYIIIIIVWAMRIHLEIVDYEASVLHIRTWTRASAGCRWQWRPRVMTGHLWPLWWMDINGTNGISCWCWPMLPTNVNIHPFFINLVDAINHHLRFNIRMRLPATSTLASNCLLTQIKIKMSCDMLRQWREREDDL